MTLEVKVSRKLIPYEVAYKELKKRVDLIKKHKSKDLLWILEHPLTYTGGVRSNEKEVLDKINSFFGYSVVEKLKFIRYRVYAWRLVASSIKDHNQRKSSRYRYNPNGKIK